jgi:phosphate transport system protein
MHTVRRFFDSELETYRSHIVAMLELARKLLRQSVDGLIQGNLESFADLKGFEAELDHLEVAIDAEAVRYLNLRAPVASELRMVLAGSRMAHDLERMGDEAKKIAKRARRVDAHAFPIFPEPFQEMATVVEGMITSILSAFTTPTDETPLEVIARDARVDALNRNITESLMQTIQDNPALLRQGVDLIACTKAMERIGDHAKNLAEVLVFISTGQDIREHPLPEGR